MSINNFIQTAQQHGLHLHNITADGEIKRVYVEGDSKGTKNGWAILFNGSPIVGIFGTWKTDFKHIWTDGNHSPVSNIHIDDLIAKSKKEKRLKYEKAAFEAQHIIKKTVAADPSHSYLLQKRIHPISLRQIGNNLIAPLQNIHGEIRSFQRIDAVGRKLFHKDGEIKGNFFLCGATRLPTKGRLYICEGVATAATIYEISNAPVATAMNAGNIEPVARQISKQRPTLDIIVAADNDHRGERNIGLLKGRSAAESIHAGFTIPKLPCSSPQCRCTDFNDIAHCKEYKS